MSLKILRPWQRSVVWLLFLGPVFFLSYGYANQLAATQATAGSLFFAWERQIPFLPWTIVPYWTIDLFYGLSFLCCRNAREVDRHALRLFTAQLISVACFLAWPLRFAFERPPADGLFGALFTALTSFDQPYNQAPSLHIGLLVLIWFQFARLPTGWPLRFLTHAWALLIGISVLTTWQHHLIDVPTGAAVGLFCLWLWPEGELTTPLKRGEDAGHTRLAALYCGGALVFLAAADALGGIAWLLAWPTLALLLVAWNYAWAGAAGFQKQAGRQSLAVRWLLAPYILGVWINSRLWTRRHPQPDLIADNVWLGRLPSRTQFAAGRFAALIDLSAELSAPAIAGNYIGAPSLDLVPASPQALLAAARAIEAQRRHGPVLVACALGYSRSAAAVAVWLRHSGRHSNLDEAIGQVCRQRPSVVLGPLWQKALRALEPALEEPA
ncbi:MAG: rane-associated phospholipid phosphatase protein [Proteobacteria bacterium]|nr:rane-associated phospholipid phosphatase protein [Pseudomonadota bacterium]